MIEEIPYNVTVHPWSKEVLAVIGDFVARNKIPVEVDKFYGHEIGSILVEKSTNRELSDAIVDRMAPAAKNAELSHYTSLEKFSSIASTNSFHLAPLAGRIGEGEYVPFAKSHRLLGVLEVADGKPQGEVFAKDLYFASFCDARDPDDDYMWNIFGSGGRGVRIDFEVEPSPAMRLRAINYARTPTLLRQLSDDLDALGKRFTLRGVWTLAAFYLNEDLQNEREWRLLAPDYPDAGLGRVENGVWPISLDGLDPYCKMTVNSVKLGVHLSKDEREVVQELAGRRGWPIVGSLG